MSCICGIVDFSGKELDFEDLRKMARAMRLRGSENACAYLKRGVGLYFASSSFEEGILCRQPTTLVQGGRSYTALIDGSPDGEAALALKSDGKSLVEAILLRYIAMSNNALCELEGAFSLALLDESRHRVFLARDSRGIKPLYYYQRGTTLIFASQIKGILAYMNDGTRVSLDAYRRLLVAPCGMLSGEDIYPDIHELPRGKFALFCDGELKLYDHDRIYPPCEPCFISPPISCDLLSAADPKTSLAEILYAFDYPRFDPYILSALEAFRSQKAKGECFFSYEDALLESDEAYAYESADRLSSLFGVNAFPVLPKNKLLSSPKRMREIEKKLSELVGELDEISRPDGQVRRLAGDTVFKILKKERNPSRRASILAMLAESVFWTEAYNLIFVD